MEHPSATLEQVRAAKAQALAEFSRLAQVVGVGVVTLGAGYGLKINLAAAPPTRAPLPTEVGGVPVRVEVVGSLKKRGKRS